MRALIFVLLCSISSLHGQSDSEELTFSVNGQLLKMKQEANGALVLLSHTYKVSAAQMASLHFGEVDETEQHRYFLLLQEGLLEVTSYNYRAVIMKYLPNAAEIHKRLGKRGFRYENLVQMIRYYNEFKSPSSPSNIFTQATVSN